MNNFKIGDLVLLTRDFTDEELEHPGWSDKMEILKQVAKPISEFYTSSTGLKTALVSFDGGKFDTWYYPLSALKLAEPPKPKRRL